MVQRQHHRRPALHDVHPRPLHARQEKRYGADGRQYAKQLPGRNRQAARRRHHHRRRRISPRPQRQPDAQYARHRLSDHRPAGSRSLQQSTRSHRLIHPARTQRLLPPLVRQGKHLGYAGARQKSSRTQCRLYQQHTAARHRHPYPRLAQPQQAQSHQLKATDHPYRPHRIQRHQRQRGTLPAQTALPRRTVRPAAAYP